MKQSSKRINGKVTKGYYVGKEFYTSIKEARIAAGEVKPPRSDKKCVSQNNVITVAMKLMYEYEVQLVTMLEAVYQDTKDGAYLNDLRLIAATKDALRYITFMACFCVASKGMFKVKSEMALQLAYKFIVEFFPEEMVNVDNKRLSRFRVRKVIEDHIQFDQGNNQDADYYEPVFSTPQSVDGVELAVDASYLTDDLRASAPERPIRYMIKYKQELHAGMHGDRSHLYV